MADLEFLLRDDKYIITIYCAFYLFRNFCTFNVVDAKLTTFGHRSKKVVEVT